MTDVLSESALNSTGRLSIIQSQGTLDWAYANFILASTAVAMDKEVEVFCTFYGLEVLKKDLSGLKINPLGNPAMRLQSPVGPDWFKAVDWNRVMPGLAWSLPGMSKLATAAFKKTLQKNGQLPIHELRELCVELGVKMTACQMTVDLLGYQAEELIETAEFAGAASYFAASPNNQSLFI
ncbi:DsrE/DsrF/DrsH-like family protein [Thiomicrorhabdus indica]|uniref:DsrE/DsrF/DrsH-like family protein n=1 Tax=Thiomicrorhabdus indica TaxID=2267253 RepID=UPI00102DA126|nr:DsrE/DsrF/DrsH-like family protein [Thiomicrorhabdus indica]